MKRSWSFKAKLVVSLLVVGSVPLALISLAGLNTIRGLNAVVSRSDENSARAVRATIDRTLFERYGDVQAFASNPALLTRAQCYRIGARQSKVVESMERYVKLYGLYDLTLAVDLEGQVIAVNDRNAAGKPIAT